MPIPDNGKEKPGAKRHLRGLLGALAVCAGLVVAVQLLMSLNHKPSLVIPDEVLALQRAQWGGSPNVSTELIERLLTVMPTCTVGKKYGALCHDGTVTYGGSENACEDNKGVKTWIECR